MPFIRHLQPALASGGGALGPLYYIGESSRRAAGQALAVVSDLGGASIVPARDVPNECGPSRPNSPETGPATSGRVEQRTLLTTAKDRTRLADNCPTA